jgi:DNA-binding CsgD family transcriptional regulator
MSAILGFPWSVILPRPLPLFPSLNPLSPFVSSPSRNANVLEGRRMNPRQQRGARRRRLCWPIPTPSIPKGQESATGQRRYRRTGAPVPGHLPAAHESARGRQGPCDLLLSTNFSGHRYRVRPGGASPKRRGHIIRVFIFLTEAIASVLFLGLASWFGVHGRRGASSRFRRLSVGIAALCLALAISSIHRLTLLAARVGWISTAWTRHLHGSWSLVVANFSLIVVAGILILARSSWLPVGRAERAMAAFARRLPHRVSLDTAGLTARETEVLDLLGTGCLSDGEIASALCISPATAATHVQNILRKTGLHNRRELMLVANS